MMRSPTWFRAFVVCLIAASLFVAAGRVIIKTAETAEQSLNRAYEPRIEEPSLPEKCRPYYNDGTDRWIECMGVGRK